MSFAEHVRALYEEMDYEPTVNTWMEPSGRKCCPLSIITMHQLLKKGEIGKLNYALDGEGSFYLLVKSVIKNGPFLSGFIAGWDGRPSEPAFWYGKQPAKAMIYGRAYEIGRKIRKAFRVEERDE